MRGSFYGNIAASNLIPSNGNVAWYDTISSEYLNLSSNEIIQFLDRSGSGNHTDSQGISISRPTWATNQYGTNSAAVFDGINDYLVLPSALYSIPGGNNTLFMVSKSNLDTTQQRVFAMSKATAGRYHLEYGSISTQMVFISRNTNVGGTFVNGAIKANPNIFTCYRSGTIQSISLNGGAAGTNTNGASESGIDSGRIGCSAGFLTAFLDGSIAEIILYNRVLSAAEIIQVNRYLSFKWGIILA